MISTYVLGIKYRVVDTVDLESERILTTLLRTQHLIPHTLFKIKIEKFNFAPPLPPSPAPGRGGGIIKIRPDSESTLLRTTLYLIPHTFIGVKIEKFIFALPRP